VKRLFIAVDVDEPTRVQVAHVVSGLSRSLTRTQHPPRITWVPSERQHLTLCFLGGADAALEHRALSALALPMPVAPFDLAFDGIGLFPARGSPRVLWLGITEGLASLRQLHDLLQQRIGARPGPHEKFTPHLTLARFRDRVGRAEVAKLSEMKASAGPCRIDRVTLYESRLSPEGPSYSVLATALLTPMASCT
jgi:RNA 2',3'-cyclic 3'-phosphodiesterase